MLFSLYLSHACGGQIQGEYRGMTNLAYRNTSTCFLCSDFVIKASFKNSTVWCSYDISSLFTNVPLVEAIDICALLLFHSDIDKPSISEPVFKELMLAATRNLN